MIGRLSALLVTLGMLAGTQGAAADEVKAPKAPKTATTPTAPPRSNDRMDLDPAAIRGNQELPKVLYIVPWKEPGPVELDGRPVNSLIDEVLAPVDREVFRRQMNYFEQLYPAAGVDKGGGVKPPSR